MTTPHDRVVVALATVENKAWGNTRPAHVDDIGPYYGKAATAAIEALREGAVERVRGFQFTCRQMGVEPIAEQLIDAVLGPPAQDTRERT